MVASAFLMSAIAARRKSIISAAVGTFHAAQKLKREWIGIDITHLAISLIEKRLNDAFPGIQYEVHGTPKDTEGARALAEKDKYQFQWWAVSLVNAVPYGGHKRVRTPGLTA